MQLDKQAYDRQILSDKPGVGDTMGQGKRACPGRTDYPPAESREVQ